MLPKIYFEFAIIYFLTLMSFPSNHNWSKLLCSKENTRLIRKIIQAKWTPIFDKFKMKMPLGCPIHPDRDIFASLHRAKIKNRPTQWTCKLCGKSFYKEKYLDLHLEHKHQNIIHETEDSVCLADYCDIMRCNVLSIQEAANIVNGEPLTVTELEVWKDTFSQIKVPSKSSGNPESMQYKNSLKSGSDSFVMPSMEKRSDNQERQLMYVQHSSGNKRNRGFRTQSQFKSQNSHFDESLLHQHSSAAPTFTSSSSQSSSSPAGGNSYPDKLSRNEYRFNIQKLRAACKEEDLEKVRKKCEIFIRTCIADLSLLMSDYNYQQMEEELNRSICWYLKCDRYWENGPLESKTFSWSLVFVVVMVLSLSVCFCYYIIWILFDSDNISSFYSNSSTTTTFDQQQLRRHQEDELQQQQQLYHHQYQHHSYPHYPYQQHHSYRDQYPQQYDQQQHQYLPPNSESGRYLRRTKAISTSAIVSSTSGKEYENSEIYNLRPYSSGSAMTTDEVALSSDNADFSNNSEHYIYVTYPIDLKRRLFDGYE